MTEAQYLFLRSEIESLRSQVQQIRTWLLILTFAVLGVNGAESLVKAFAG